MLRNATKSVSKMQIHLVGHLNRTCSCLCSALHFFSPQDGQSRTVRQFQFTDWPEQGVPKSGEGFIDFIGQVHKTKEQFGQDGPIAVHCRFVVALEATWLLLEGSRVQFVLTLCAALSLEKST